MLKFIFFFFAFIAIIYEFWSVKHYDKLAEFRRKVDMVKSKKSDISSFSGGELFLFFMHFLYFFWAFVGLFSSQWEFFILLIGLSLLNGVFKSEFWNLIDSVLTVIILGLSILNAFHWHINVFREVLNFYTGN